jgi:hypothetical protein
MVLFLSFCLFRLLLSKSWNRKRQTCGRALEESDNPLPHRAEVIPKAEKDLLRKTASEAPIVAETITYSIIMLPLSPETA